MMGRMRKTALVVLVLGLFGVFALPSVAATSKTGTHASSAHPAKKASKASTARKKAVAKHKTTKKHASRKASTSTKSSASRVRRCHFVKSHGKTRKVCKWVTVRRASTLMKSPIRADALDTRKSSKEDDDDARMRSAPYHAYAVDGRTFFYQGKKYRVAGISGTGGSDMDKQRLQKALDGGQLKIESIHTDAAGQTSANVTVDGKSLLEQIN